MADIMDKKDEEMAKAIAEAEAKFSKRQEEASAEWKKVYDAEVA